MAERPWYESSYKTESGKGTSKAATKATIEVEEIPTCWCGMAESNHEPCPECKTVTHLGQWPFCKGDPTKHEGGIKHYGFEPYCDEHILPGGADYSVNLYGERVHGTWIGSRSERQEIMKKNGIVSGGKINRKQSSKMDFDGRAERIARDAIETWNRNR